MDMNITFVSMGRKLRESRSIQNQRGYGQKRVKMVKRLKRGGKLFHLLQYPKLDEEGEEK